MGIQIYFKNLLKSTGLLALPQGLIESLTQRDVGLLLSALDEALDLPGAGSLGFLGLRLTVLRLLGVGWLLLLLELLILVTSTTTTTHTTSEGAAHHMSHRTAHRHSTSSHGHLLHHAGLLGLTHHRSRSSRRSSHRRVASSRSRSWGRSSSWRR